MTPPRKDTGIFLHRLTPLVTSSSGIILAFLDHSHRVSIVRMWDPIGEAPITGTRWVGWTGVIERSISYPRVAESCHFASRTLRVFWDRGGWVIGVARLGRVSKNGLRVYVYAHKKRWSEEGYVRMSGMGLWNRRWMGDDDTASRSLFQRLEQWLVSRKKTRAPRWRCDRVIDHQATRTSFNSRMRRNSRWHDVTCGWFGDMHGSRDDDTSRRRKFDEDRPICDFRHRVHSERWVDRLNLEIVPRDRLSLVQMSNPVINRDNSLCLSSFHRCFPRLSFFFLLLPLLNFTISWPWADSI